MEVQPAWQYKVGPVLEHVHTCALTPMTASIFAMDIWDTLCSSEVFEGRVRNYTEGSWKMDPSINGYGGSNGADGEGRAPMRHGWRWSVDGRCGLGV